MEISQEELQLFAQKRMQEFDAKEAIRKEHELKINIKELEDLLDFKTYFDFLFSFKEHEQFSLEFIVRLIRKYKTNNKIESLW